MTVLCKYCEAEHTRGVAVTIRFGMPCCRRHAWIFDHTIQDIEDIENIVALSVQYETGHITALDFSQKLSALIEAEADHSPKHRSKVVQFGLIH